MWLIVFSAATRLRIEFEIYSSIWCRNKGGFTKGIFRVFKVTDLHNSWKNEIEATWIFRKVRDKKLEILFFSLKLRKFAESKRLVERESVEEMVCKAEGMGCCIPNEVQSNSLECRKHIRTYISKLFYVVL